MLTIERELRAAQVSVWRDQDKLYGGQRWPKALSEAIAAQDYLLLCWSKSAAASTNVELEWCAALALKKTIIPCLLDDAPLPPSDVQLLPVGSRKFLSGAQIEYVIKTAAEEKLTQREGPR
ncbi:MAG: toll/interleukin-1 receptor domain-containing protein [Gammaproteobacteria bacterium]